MTFNRAEFLAEMERLTKMEIPLLENEEFQASRLTDEEIIKAREDGRKHRLFNATQPLIGAGK